MLLIMTDSKIDLK